MAIADDFSVAVNGDIRYTGTTANYTVIAFHRYLGALMDDAQASGDDLLDISDATASERATDNYITLNPPYNIDWVVAQHLYDGSIVQSNGDERWDGFVVYAPAGTPLQILQGGAPASPNFWGTALNADSAMGISHRFMLKVRSGGSDIDGRRLIGQTREVGKTFTEFKVNGTNLGNNTIALSYANDLNNATAEATIRGWTTIDNTTEGYKLMDVDNDTVDEPYYSEWNRAAKTINEFYERHKWLHRESTVEDSCSDSGSDFQVGNATVIGQSQSFPNGVNAQLLTRVRVTLKKVGAPTGNLTAVLYTHSGTYGSSSIPTAAALATSVNFDVSKLTTAYKEYEIEFSTQYEMAASTNYCIAFELPVIDGSNYVCIQGLATTGTHGGNRAQLVTTTWTPTATDDLAFEVYASPKMYGIPGEAFRGVTHEVVVDAPTGTFSAVEPVSWTGGTGQMLAIDSVIAGTKMWIQLLSGVAPTNDQVITGESTATATVNVTVTARTVSAPPVGASTGTSIVGAYGLGIETADLSASDKITDLDNELQTPPNNVTYTCGGLVSGEDRILTAPLGYIFAYDTEASGPFQLGETLTFATPAGTGYLSALTDDGTTGRMQIRLLTGSVPEDNSTISGGTSGATAAVDGTVKACEDPRQLKLNTTLSGATETAVVCTASIPTDTPSSGTIRIQLNSGIYRRVAYTSYTSATFTIAETDFSGDNATGGAGENGNSIFISYIDETASAATADFTGVYLADRNLFTRVRDGASTPIKTFETTAVLGSAGGSTTAIRTSDA